MLKEIQQAENAIKEGDTRTAFEILRQVLAENPDSERAWWVMSGLVPRDQRAHCLQQVLRINPDNQFAREALGRFQAAEALKEKQPEGAPAGPELADLPAQPPSPPTRGHHAWYYARKSKIYLSVLANEGVICAVTEPQLLPKVRAALDQGKLPNDLVKDRKAIPYKRVTSIRQLLSSVRVYYRTPSGEDSIRLELEDTNAADQVMAVLRTKLEPDFTLIQEPMKLGSALGITAILLLGSGGITAFFLWGAFEVQSGRASATGSFRTRSIINLLEILGPTGVGIIGGILILIALIISARVLFNRPTITELKRVV